MHVPTPFSGKQQAFLVYLNQSLRSFSRKIFKKELSKGLVIQRNRKWIHKKQNHLQYMRGAGDLIYQQQSQILNMTDLTVLLEPGGRFMC